MSEVKLILGDCLDKLKDLESNSVDSIVTDPPYGLSFMGQKWDYDVPSVNIWKECLRVLKPGGHLLSFAGSRTYHRMAVNIEDAGFVIRDQIMWVYGSGFPKSHNLKNDHQGWGTALKPAHEPIVLARKPFKGTVADNVLEYGTGAINIDGCRVEEGRWPANFIHDGSEEVLEHFPHTKSGKMGPEHNRHTDSSPNGIYGKFDVNHPLGQTYGDAGSAARFFYVAKANKKDREEDNNHPTIKPTELMKYLIRLVTPKNGTILDPFMGSGSTGKAAVLEGFSFIGIELSEEYLKIAEKRINHAITVNE